MTIWVIYVLTGGRGCEGGQVWGHARRRGCGTARTRPAGAADIVGRLMRGEVCVECSRNPVKQHICCFYWLTRGGAAAVGERAGGGVLGSQRVPARPGFDCIYTNFCRPGGCRRCSCTEVAESSSSLFRRVVVEAHISMTEGLYEYD